MAGSLEGRKALITGASSGIGEATARAMVAEGASVALGARRKDRLDELASSIEADGGTALAIEADITDEEQAKNLVETANAELGGLDCLVNNAGVMLLGPLQGADPSRVADDARRQLPRPPLLHPLRAADDARRRGGDMVNVASVAGRIAALGSGVYNMTKWGVVGYSESLRQECAHIGVRVTCVEPGFVETELQGHNKNPMVVEQMEKIKEDIGKVLEADDIASAIVFAVSQPEHVRVNEILVRPSGEKR